MNIYGQVGWRAASTAPAVDDAQAFINAAGITNPTQQSAITTLVSQLKGYGIWTKMKAIYPFVGGTAEQHRWNLKDTTQFKIDWFGGGTHSANGYLPNGNSYGNTYLTPSLHSTSGQNHLSFYARTPQSTNAVPIGAYDSATIRYNQMNISTGVGYAYYDGDLSTEMFSSISSSTGFFIGTTRASNDRKSFQNGISIASKTTNSSTSYCALPIAIGGRNTFNGADTYTTQQSAFASIGDGLTDTEAANFYTAVQAYQTTLGRQV